MDFPYIIIHAVSRTSFSRPCVYCQLDCVKQDGYVDEAVMYDVYGDDEEEEEEEQVADGEGERKEEGETEGEQQLEEQSQEKGKETALFANDELDKVAVMILSPEDSDEVDGIFKSMSVAQSQNGPDDEEWGDDYGDEDGEGIMIGQSDMMQQFYTSLDDIPDDMEDKLAMWDALFEGPEEESEGDEVSNGE
eukprot:TRINITY_DN2690_c0_g5_i1.p2 TRINITY_DN2690_c0_g5~~TRINITY_DN2690_c0_g5_i1.p2  ORF type:complete len:192 (-),score=74.43 TRINITY_DN2690_c0_g5_i1:31-606(-)